VKVFKNGIQVFPCGYYLLLPYDLDRHPLVVLDEALRYYLHLWYIDRSFVRSIVESVPSPE
jgi:hypothetical protein